MNKEKKLPKNEIDTLWNVFVEYHFLIAIMTFLSVILSVIYAVWIYKPVYSATALVQIGKENKGLIMPAEEVESKLLEKYEIYINPNKSLPKISAIKILKRSKGIIRFTAQGEHQEKLKKYLKEQINVLSLEHNISLDEFVKENSENLTKSINSVKQTRAEFQKIKTDVDISDKKISTFTNENQALINMYMIKMLRDDMSLERNYKRLITYNKEVSKYKKHLLKTRTFSTHIIDNVVMQQKSVTPSKGIIVVIGLISGLFFSLLIAFFLSFLATRRE